MSEKTDGELIAERYWDLLLSSETYLDPWIAFSRAGIKWDNDSVYTFVHYVTADGLSKWFNANVGTIHIEHDEYEEIDYTHLVKLFKSGVRDFKKFEAKAKAEAENEARAKAEAEKGMDS